MYFYQRNKAIIATEKPIKGLSPISEEACLDSSCKVYLALEKDPLRFRSFFRIVNEDILSYSHEDVTLLNRSKSHLLQYPLWLRNAIEQERAYFINTSYEHYLSFIPEEAESRKHRINIVGLGDVGGILATGLKLLGADTVSDIGIYDKDENKIKRWLYELSAIKDIEAPKSPKITPLKEHDLFNCDMFVFCVSVGVPQIGSEGKDVRMVQFEGNKKVVSYYAQEARRVGFKGLFAVVSDPVDLLCKAVFLASNSSSDGRLDLCGIPSHKIRGYGLGVMNGRASYFAVDQGLCPDYQKDGRVFGPHGEGLIAANSIRNYDDALSSLLTDKTKSANLEVRAAGFKPYIAPALSSGAISLLATLKEHWHYSSTFLGGIFMGARCKYQDGVTIFEDYSLPQELLARLKETEELLHKLY